MNRAIAISHRRRSRQCGTAMLEIALSFTAFMLLTIGVMEFAMAVYAYNFCTSAAIEATRWASVRGSQYCASNSRSALTATDITNHILPLAIGFDPSNISVSATWTPDNTPGSIVRVTVGYTVLPLVGLAQKQNIQVSYTSQTPITY